MSLKDLTWEHHKYAETRPFVKVLFSGKITPEAYATYLFNQHKCYDMLEAMAMMHGLMNDYPAIRRAPAIFEDFRELWADKETLPTQAPTVAKYHTYLMSIMDNPKKLLAHLYVRHFGDLSGGQMIAKRVPGEGKYYQFDGDTTEIKNLLRAKLDDSLAEEAAVCFKFAADMFDDLEQIVNNEKS